MKIGVFTVLFSDEKFESALEKVKRLGVEAVEIGCGNYPGNAHCQPEKLLDDPAAIKNFKQTVEKYNLTISALSCHGNPLHPDPSISNQHRDVQRKTILLAEKLEVNRVITFSGCPGDCETAKYPNWVTCAWPDDFLKILKWQWEEKIIPYWKEEAKFAKEHNVKICIEMHPGFSVYNPETLLKLRDACGENIGANFDPSHLFWQGIDPLKALLKLKDVVFHIHAKDTRIDPSNTQLNGVLDTKTYVDLPNRSWIFRTVGYGHDEKFWRDFVSTLRLIGYDDVLSIEHEDALIGRDEGLSKAINFLKSIILAEPMPKPWWI